MRNFIVLIQFFGSLHMYRLISMSDHTASMVLISTYKTAFEQLLSEPQSTGAGQGRLKHLEYLTTVWMPLELWQSWSEFGRLAASALLKIPAEGVIPTTNHLESFNVVLKRKHLASALHSGHQLQFDSLIHILITCILPGIFSHQRALKDYRDWLARRFHTAAGNQDLVAIHKEHLRGKALERQKHQALGWWGDDSLRDSGAREIINQTQMKFSKPSPDAYSAQCTPSRAVGVKSDFVDYDITCCRNGEASCSCPDFQT